MEQMPLRRSRSHTLRPCQVKRNTRLQSVETQEKSMQCKEEGFRDHPHPLYMHVLQRVKVKRCCVARKGGLGASCTPSSIRPVSYRHRSAFPSLAHTHTHSPSPLDPLRVRRSAEALACICEYTDCMIPVGWEVSLQTQTTNKRSAGIHGVRMWTVIIRKKSRKQCRVIAPPSAPPPLHTYAPLMGSVEGAGHDVSASDSDCLQSQT